MRMDKDICKVMFNEVELQGVCKRLGEQITKDYEGKDLLIVGILNGAIVFVTDLMRQIDRQINIDFMSVSSYGNGTTSSGNIHVAKDLNSDIAGRNVLIVDSGYRQHPAPAHQDAQGAQPCLPEGMRAAG